MKAYEQIDQFSVYFIEGKIVVIIYQHIVAFVKIFLIYYFDIYSIHLEIGFAAAM